MQFLNCSHTGAFTLQDMHSLMLMVCSDIPLRVPRSAFKAASPLLPSGGSFAAVHPVAVSNPQLMTVAALHME